MKLTKEYCIDIKESMCDGCLYKTYVGAKCSCGAKELFEQLLEEHFDNPPLKYEELHKRMWVWDNLTKEWLYITRLSVGHVTKRKYFHYLGIYTGLEQLKKLDMVFEDNRFYRREVQDETN